MAAAFVAGFPATLVLAWTFDLGPEGFARTTASRAQGWMAICCAAVLMVGGTTGLFYLIEPVAQLEVSQPVAVAHNSIAVYPFVNLSSDRENAYFSDGMTSELIARLSQLKGLQIAAISRTREQTLALGLEPEVQYRLEGTVRKSGDRVRITARLENRSSGFSIWSEDFDGELLDVFKLQEQTAMRIAQALNLQLSPQEESALAHRDTSKPGAYDAFLRGWSLIESFHVRSGSPGPKLTAARRHFQDALSLDPSYARALAGLAMVENYSVLLQLEPQAHQAQAREFANRALVLGAELPEPHFAMAGVLANSMDFGGSVAAYRRTLQLDSQNGFAWCELSSVLIRNDPLGAEEAAREAIRLRPAYATAYYNLGAALQKQHRLRDAADAYQQSLQLSPGNSGLQKTIAQLYFESGNYAESLTHLENLETTPELREQIRLARQALAR